MCGISKIELTKVVIVCHISLLTLTIRRDAPLFLLGSSSLYYMQVRVFGQICISFSFPPRKLNGKQWEGED